MEGTGGGGGYVGAGVVVVIEEAGERVICADRRVLRTGYYFVNVVNNAGTVNEGTLG